MGSIPPLRIRTGNHARVRSDGAFVLYWMISARRCRWNFALQRAVEWAVELGKPMVVLEPLRSGYRWASDRMHTFILEGMAHNAREFEGKGVRYYPYVEREKDEGKGLLATLAASACVVVTDEFPCFFLPRMVAAAAARVPVLFETVDSNGILPMAATERVFTTAYAFRRFLQKTLPGYLVERPEEDPLRGVTLPEAPVLSKDIPSRWPPASPDLLAASTGVLETLPIDHRVGPGIEKGGALEAEKALGRFVNTALDAYPEQRNQPELEATSGLSPYLHFGHISCHEIFHRIMEHEDWFFHRLASTATGSRTGWWGMGPGAEAFLDQLITWRELGFNMCRLRDDYDAYESLPDWPRATLRAHGADQRPYLYTIGELEEAGTHDPLWNAAQMQLVTEGRLHNYLRMLWGKKILEWSPSARDALEIMIHLNNTYALDGRDPNSYSGIFWVLGRYDRAWGPERPVFGKIRYMSSVNTARKVRVNTYMKRYGP